MGYWSYVEHAAGMGRYYAWVLLGVVAAALVLGALAPGARLRLRGAVMLLGVSFLGMLVCALLPYRGVLDTESAGYRWSHFAAQFVFTIAVINIASVLLFRVLLEPVRLQPAPILRDTLVG